MIILEGPDGSGKTTLLKELRKIYSYPLSPRVVSKNTKARVNLKSWVDHNLLQGFQAKFFDRHRLVSESVYGPILRDKAEPGFANLDWMSSRLRAFYKLNPIIIYCLPPLEEVKFNLRNDQDNLAVVHKTESIYQAYVNRIALDLMHHPETTYVWDYTKSDSKIPYWALVHLGAQVDKQLNQKGNNRGY